MLSSHREQLALSLPPLMNIPKAELRSAGSIPDGLASGLACSFRTVAHRGQLAKEISSSLWHLSSSDFQDTGL